MPWRADCPTAPLSVRSQSLTSLLLYPSTVPTTAIHLALISALHFVSSVNDNQQENRQVLSISRTQLAHIHPDRFTAAARSGAYGPILLSHSLDILELSANNKQVSVVCLFPRFSAKRPSHSGSTLSYIARQFCTCHSLGPNGKR